ncbi:MAG: helix-turn-helix transcriptional regulator [Actinomycetota bacterium]
MRAGDLVREARRRAHLTQDELSRRVGTTQSAIARLERRGTEPSLRRTNELLRACGMNLDVRLLAVDDSDWSVAHATLALDIDARVRQHQAALRFARAGRSAMERDGRA